ncbi:sensor histidine kinase [Enterococcus sp. AZ109]|uniref:sensor histidine kinase n=1 Tax=Enterococcus sp. AZ109 TaxID=2774634 RepID=UPI003F1E6533
MNKWYRDRKKTLQFQLASRFSAILLFLIILLSSLILSVTGIRLYESTRGETEAIEDALSQVDTQTNQAWKETLQLYIAADDPRYYIRVSIEDGSTVYSSEAYQLYNRFDQLNQLFFLPGILWDGDDPYYLKQFSVGTTKVAIFTSMEDHFEVFITLISWVSLLSLAIMIVGTSVIYRFSKRISQPLIVMNREIQQLADDLQLERPLTEPENPIEIQNVAKSFNNLIHTQKQLIEREQQFITDASHELKTPLAAIRGHINLIKRRSKEHPEVIPKSLNFIDTESKRMETLTQQLLILDREKKNLLIKETVELSSMIESILEEFPKITQQIEIRSDSEVHLIGNREHFYQIFKNLIENALKYTPVDGFIAITLSQNDQSITFSVSNTGQTISDNEKQLIFERFYRLDQSRSSAVPGSGIGLAIVKQLVQLYHGTIVVTDFQPQGAVFSVTFPQNERTN